jgi:hypothetical protein
MVKLKCILISYSSSYSLMALQPCVGLGLLHGGPPFTGRFVTVNFSTVGSLPPHPTSQPAESWTTVRPAPTL